MSGDSNIFEVITSLLTLGATIYVVVLVCLAVTCLVHFWMIEILPKEKVWVGLPVGLNKHVLIKMDKEIAQIMVEVNERYQLEGYKK